MHITPIHHVFRFPRIKCRSFGSRASPDQAAVCSPVRPVGRCGHRIEIETRPVIKKIKRALHSRPFESYAHIVSPLSKDEGGGFMITFPDLPGCMSDGETVAEAVRNGRDAFESWISARIDAGKPIPEPAY